MRIEGSNRAEVPGPTDGNDRAERSARQRYARDAKPPEGLVIGESACQTYIRKASACEEINLQAVADAKKMVESGQLDTQEAVERAAEGILSMGI